MNDLVVEETDEFIVFLNSSDEGVMIGLSSTIVAIVDNDSEYADAFVREFHCKRRCFALN